MDSFISFLILDLKSVSFFLKLQISALDAYFLRKPQQSDIMFARAFLQMYRNSVLLETKILQDIFVDTNSQKKISFLILILKLDFF